jgi:hypothetical protein
MPGTVLVLDYAGHREEAPISSLDLESAGFDVRYLLQPPYPREFNAPDYAAGLLLRHGPLDPDLVAVLAYCMAAPIAQELVATASSSLGRAVPMVLFDGEPVTVPAVRSQYHVAGRKLGELLSLPAEDSVPEGVVDEASLRDSPSDAVQMMREGLVGLGGKAAATAGVDPDEAMDDAAVVADFYVDWLAHLVAGCNATWPAWRGAVFQFVSSDNQALPAWPGACATRTSRVAASRNELLRHPGTRAGVLSVLRKQARE